MGEINRSIGGETELTVRGGDEGRRVGVVYSEAADGDGVLKGFPVPLSDPIVVLETGTFDVGGQFRPSPVPVPADPSWIGKSVFYLAGTRDAGGEVRFSNLLTVVHQP